MTTRTARAASTKKNDTVKAKVEQINKLDAAAEQQAALKAWEKGGREGDRPATPDYDAIRDAVPEQKATPKRTATGEGRRTKLGPRGQEGSKVMREKGGVRGRGRKLTHDELVAHLVGVLKKHPDTTALDELYFAHWIEGIAVSKDRMIAAFDEAKSGKPAKVTTKVVGATPVPVKVTTTAEAKPAPKPAAKQTAAQKRAATKRAAEARVRTLKAAATTA